mmetsp:Transcript_6992/g.15428  ORF Transcript_6992/g.15428 Transcript_6992/m.15428 type:complete len:707 (+) Transcript_6992:43-2163(+)
MTTKSRHRDDDGHGSAWGYVLSALVGSALTFIAVDYLHHRRRKQIIITRGPNNDNKDSVRAGNNGGAIQREESVCNDKSNGEPMIDKRKETNQKRNDDYIIHGEGHSSFSGNFNSVDGEERHSNDSLRFSSIGSSGSIDDPEDIYNSSNETQVLILSETPEANEEAIMHAREYDNKVLSKLRTLNEAKLLLHRTRAVAALASRLMAAPDEESCYEVASRLIVPLFCVDRCAFTLLKDADHIIIKNVAVNKRQHATKLGLEGKTKFGGGGVVKPIKDTMVSLCATTLQQQYCPRTKGSSFPAQQMAHSMGINSILATPILVNGNKFTGAILVSMSQEDAFAYHDRILVQDIASMLGANIYAKRMRRAAEQSLKVSSEMLHSMIPPQVISKIEMFWDENTVEYKSRRPSSRCSGGISSGGMSTTTFDDSIHDSIDDDLSDEYSIKSRGEERPSLGMGLRRCESVNERINFLNQMNNVDVNSSNVGVMVDTSEMEIQSHNGALYAENVENVVIIFSDIVGFSKMALDIDPMGVMNMLQSLFGRFDALCDKHGVEKHETIGDAYICTANLFDDDHFGGDVKEAALSALHMAKDMIYASQEVTLPRQKSNKSSPSSPPLEKLQIRVGIHVGEITCGVLGERLPKFTIFGHNVNLAARMEQTGKPNKIRVTETFHDLLVPDVEEEEWDEFEVVPVKNMGEAGTYVMDPLKWL